MEGERTTSTLSDGNKDGGQRTRPLHGRTSGPTRRSTKGQWTAEEDEILRQAVERFKGKNWKKIAECFKDRTDVQCLHRWQKVLNPELVKGPWSKEEDEIIIELVNKYGPKKWSTIAQHLPGRIGKQCRERWHNHLNPGINKEAWTQEEELALIRAHQIYGNRWAELTKFLPGRTDNAIKNHWNSSVKKKLDTYLASGLLAQFPAFPHAGFQNQLIASSSSRMQTSGVDASSKVVVETEENSECSQGSTVGCSQSTNDVALGIGPKSEESVFARERNSSPVSCSEQYYPSMEEVNHVIPDVHSEICCSSNLLHHNFACEAETSALKDKLNGNDLPIGSLLEFKPETSGVKTQCTSASENRGGLNVPFQTSLGLVVPSVGCLGLDADRLHQILISDDECCRFLFPDAMVDDCFSTENISEEPNRTNGGGSTDASMNQSSNFQISEKAGNLSSQPDASSRHVALGASCVQASDPASMFSSGSDPPIFGGQSSQFETHEAFENGANNGFIYTNGSADSLPDNVANLGMLEQLDMPKEQSRLDPANVFCSRSDVMQTCSLEDGSSMQMAKSDSGSLFYEPPRFPSVDVPFFSCDLIQASDDMQQEYSPLGIRQLMMSTVSCISPFRSWDSPSHDKSPDVVLKSAAKTFTSTPSILKKRSRDMLSPLSDRRMDKKLETDITSDLTRDFSRLDVMLEEPDPHRASLLSHSITNKRSLGEFVDDKDNSCICAEGRQDKNEQSAVPDNKSLQEICDGGIDMEKEEQRTVCVDIKAESGADLDATTQSVQQPTDALGEQDINELLLFSPDQTCNQASKTAGLMDGTPSSQFSKRREIATTDGITLESPSGNSCLCVSSPTVGETRHRSSKVAAVSTLSLPSAVSLEVTVDNTFNEASFENFSIFGGTPFRRSLESPSAWKSPWFINSFLPGPRIETEITVEDIGLFMSPGERSYDALGLMKHLSEHSAAAYANAQEVLGKNTPETAEKKKLARQNLDRENHDPNPQTESRSHMPSTLLVECRTLDFSECGTPGKSKEIVKSSAGSMCFSSPSASSLLKGFR